jgi:SPP1 family predicted phage head-tail adaptor
VSAGSYRHYLQLLAPTTADTGRGGQSVTWPTSGTAVWGHVRTASSREQAAAGALQTVASHVVEVHYDARITADKRLRRVAPSGPTLEILGIRDVDGRQRTLELACAEVI